MIKIQSVTSRELIYQPTLFSSLFVDAVCEVKGVKYKPGETYTADDGCNECTCNDDGSVTCTTEECPTGKMYTVDECNLGVTGFVR